jgi:hypothetical protein
VAAIEADIEARLEREAAYRQEREEAFRAVEQYPLRVALDDADKRACDFGNRDSSNDRCGDDCGNHRAVADYLSSVCSEIDTQHKPSH